MPDEKEFDFFVSYTGHDELWARWVVRVLSTAGYRVMSQFQDFGAGNFVEKMEEAIAKSDYVLPVLTEAYLGSKWSSAEWTAFARDRRIIPIQVGEVVSRSQLSQYTRVNLRGLDEAVAQQRLLTKLPWLVELATRPASGVDVEDAPFPGVQAGPGPGRGPVPLAVAAPHRVPLDRDQLQLVVLGSGPDGATSHLTALFGVPPGLDLYNSPLPPAQQRDALRRALTSGTSSALVVAFVGSGTDVPKVGLQLSLAPAVPGGSAGTLGLGTLLDDIRDQLDVDDDSSGRPAAVLLDVVDQRGRAAVLPERWNDVALLDLRGPSGAGLADLMGLLTGPPAGLARELHHRAPLTLGDLAELSGDALQAGDDDPFSDLGLVPNPLAWPDWPPQPSEAAGNWCVVLSAADGGKGERSVERAVQSIEESQHHRLASKLRKSTRLRKFGREIKLDPVATRCVAGDVLTSPAALAQAVDRVCRAEVAVFDLTNFEPAVMFLLGVRSVIRRGVTLCVQTGHADTVRKAEPPFHVREISVLENAGPKEMVDRLIKGLGQRDLPGCSYQDLPSFSLARSVPPDETERTTRSFGGRENDILALVPFSSDYDAHWARLEEQLGFAAVAALRREADDGDEPDAEEPDAEVRILRTLDMLSPRLVSAQLYEAMRLVDFCLVDLTLTRPNVVFELGVRLAMNRLHPVVVRDRGTPHPHATQPWAQNAQAQCDQLGRLLNAVEYRLEGGPFADYTAMVERHLALRKLVLHPLESPYGEPLDQVPSDGVYRHAWQHTLPDDETVTIPMHERLKAQGEELFVDERAGGRHSVYPAQHPLRRVADQAGTEYMVAAWLYLHFRGRHLPGGADDQLHEDLTEDLEQRLRKDDPDSADAVFLEMMAKWTSADGGGDG